MNLKQTISLKYLLPILHIIISIIVLIITNLPLEINRCDAAFGVFCLPISFLFVSLVMLPGRIATLPLVLISPSIEQLFSMSNTNVGLYTGIISSVIVLFIVGYLIEKKKYLPLVLYIGISLILLFITLNF